VLTARGEDVIEFWDWNLGRMINLPKPFNPRELVARIRAILRRTQGLGDAKQPVCKPGRIELDTATRTVRQAVCAGGVDIGGVRAAGGVAALRGQVVTREKLAATVLGRKFARLTAASTCKYPRCARSWAIRAGRKI